MRGPYRLKLIRKGRKWLTILSIMSTTFLLSSCAPLENNRTTPSGYPDLTEEKEDRGSEVLTIDDLHKTGSLELKYAEGFSADLYEEGYTLITIPNTGKYLVADEGTPDFEATDDITIIKKPINDIYLASSSAMDFFRSLDSLDLVSFTSTKASDWSLPEVKNKIEDGDIVYVGKYNSPDYERLINGGCKLTIENTMIYHNPEAKELLEKLGIPVIVERSSYERHPLGRLEWIKFYAILAGREKEAEAFFKQHLKELDKVIDNKEYDKEAVIFFVTGGGYINVKKPGDYMAKMIELAGGRYALSELEEGDATASSSMNISMEDFYINAKDADILIYNSTIDGEIETIEDLIDKDRLFSEFKAVKEGNVWCSKKDLFQEATRVTQVIKELQLMMSENEADESGFENFHRLK